MRGWVAILVVACGGKSEADVDPPLVEVDTVCPEPPCDTGSATDGDGRPEDATPIGITEAAEAAGTIAPAGDIDWWVYAAGEAQWIDVRALSEGDLDTVVRVWTDEGEEWAAIDNYATGYADGFDSLLRVYLPTAGDWFVTVEDVTTYYDDLFSDDDWRGDSNFDYQLWLQPYDNILAETDALDDPSGELALTTGTSISHFGLFVDEPGDSDWVSLDLQVGGLPVEVWAQPANYGSNLDVRVRLYDASGTLLADKSDVGPDGYLSYFDPPVGTYTIEVTDVAGAGSDEAWGVLYVRTYEPDLAHPFFGTSTYLQETEPNEDVSTASAVTMVPEGDASFPYDAGRIGGTLAAPGDLDTWAFPATAGFVSARCFTEAFGSLAVLSVRLLDPSGADVTPADQGEVPNGDYWLANVPVATGGEHALEVASLDGVTGLQSYYRCAVFVSEGEVFLE